MIEDKAIIKGGSIYIEELNITFSKSEILEMDNKNLTQVLAFMNEKELDKIQNGGDMILLKVMYIFERL